MQLLKYKDKLKFLQSDSGTMIFDPIRKKYVVFTKEEMVRQLLILFLKEEQGIAKSRIAVERGLNVEKMFKRFDLLIFSKNAKPIMLVECKAPGHKLDQKTIDQAGIYNSKLKTPYLMVTNGVDNFIFQIDFEKGSFDRLREFPDLNL